MAEGPANLRSQTNVIFSKDTSELAKSYDKLSDLQFESGCILLKGMGIKSGDTLLDVGCGTGRLALYVSELIGPNGGVTGIDPSPQRIDTANDKLNGPPAHNVRFRIGYGENLCDYSVCSFDHVYSCHVIHWIDDKATALEEAYRVLRPGGKIGITTMDRDKKHGRTALQRSGDGDRKDILSHRMLNGDQLRALLADAGFINITIHSEKIKQYFSSPREVFEFWKSSSFGNLPTGGLSGMTDQQRAEARRKRIEELEKRRTPMGIELQSEPLIAIAMKPYKKES